MPKMLDTGALAAMCAAGIKTDEIAKSTGTAQPHNIATRAADFMNEEISQKFADRLDEQDEEDDGDV